MDYEVVTAVPQTGDVLVFHGGTRPLPADATGGKEYPVFYKPNAGWLWADDSNDARLLDLWWTSPNAELRRPKPADLRAANERFESALGVSKPADDVNHPAHYTAGGVECIDAIRAALTPEEFRGFCKGNILKYTWREKLKGGDESLKKARWYTNQLVGE